MSVIESVKIVYKRGKMKSLEKKIQKFPRKRERLMARHLKRLDKYESLRKELDRDPHELRIPG